MSDSDRHPLPPEILAGALQDRVYQTSWRLLSAKAVRVRHGYRDLTEDEQDENLEDNLFWFLGLTALTLLARRVKKGNEP